MISLENILLIILIILILNKIKIKRPKEDFKIMEVPNVNYNERPIKTPYYGDIQYDVKDNDNSNIVFEYQDFDILKSKNDNILDNTLKMNEFIPEQNKDILYKNNFGNKYKKVMLPCEESDRYDIKFFQPSDTEIYNPIDLTKIVYTDRKIQDVYNDIVNDVKKLHPKKKLKDSNNQKKMGAFGENTLSNLDWEYEEDDDGMSFDPELSNLLAL